MTTTAFSTHGWTAPASARRLLARLGAALGLALLLMASGAAWADPAEVTQLRLEKTEEGVLLSATVRFDLPPTVEDALLKGMPMYFVADTSLLRDRWYWYDKHVAGGSRHMRLSFQPLTRRWRLQVSAAPIGSTGVALGQSFETREEALAAVQHISRWKIAELGDLEPDARYSIDFRFRLDVSQLPRPFQIGTVGHAEWNISAERSQRLAVENGR